MLRLQLGSRQSMLLSPAGCGRERFANLVESTRISNTPQLSERAGTPAYLHLSPSNNCTSKLFHSERKKAFTPELMTGSSNTNLKWSPFGASERGAKAHRRVETVRLRRTGFPIADCDRVKILDYKIGRRP